MKDDMTRRAVMKAAKVSERIVARLAEQIPYGPNKVGFQPVEVLRKFNQMSPAERQVFMQQMGGPEFTLEFLNGITPKK